MIGTFIYVIIAIIILFYVIDKKKLIPPKEVEITPIKEEGIKKAVTTEEKKQEIYNNIYTSLKEINPLKTYRSWTYIEIPNKTVNIQLSYNKMNIPEYFQECIQLMKKNIPELIVLTPFNITEYLPNFPIVMKHSSNIPLKLRIDILFAHILETYGGLCISPGTIVYNINKALSMLNKYEIVTFGSSTPMNTGSVSQYYPDTYIIGSKPDTELIKNYKKQLLTTTYKNSSEILSECLQEKEYKHIIQ